MITEKRCVIAGSRSFKDYKALCETMTSVLKEEGPIAEVISGTARGADTLGEQWAKEYNIAIKRMPANWDKHGKSAGYIRNKEMAELADIVVLFWDNKSVGTQHMLKLAKAAKNKPKVYIYSYINAV